MQHRPYWSLPLEEKQQPQNLTQQPPEPVQSLNPQPGRCEPLNLPSKPHSQHAFRLPPCQQLIALGSYSGERHLQARPCSSRASSASGPAQAMGETAAPCSHPHSAAASAAQRHAMELVWLILLPSPQRSWERGTEGSPRQREALSGAPKSFAPQNGSGSAQGPSTACAGHTVFPAYETRCLQEENIPPSWAGAPGDSS